MKGEQIEMFAEQTPATAAILPFPVDREMVFIRTTARALEQRNGLEADKFWKSTCRRLYARLQVQGLPASEIKLQIAKFANSVHAEMQRAAWAAWESDNPKGAA
ncbi:hypothetical protein I7I49_15370 [Sinorhizobium meliloti]|uniref:DUF6074 family protein n=1 Tax=Rhizobium meliloti TaxID=382 RepID=UPI00237F5013|nr:DUF6074 family protein [Sinorhizobium meliloti]MDE3811655.1 hypothetical protein [Sinorhizobium meliloti]